MSKQASAVPQLPNEQAKVYPSELMDFYALRFGLTPENMKIRPVRYLVKSKIDADIFAAQQGERIVKLEAKIAALLGFVGKYGKLKPREGVTNAKG